MKILVAVAALIACAWPAAALQEPSLAEAARKEKEKRARAGSQTKVLTEEDLRKGQRGAAPTTSESSPTPAAEAPKAGAPVPAAAANVEKTDEQLRAERRAELQKKMDEQGRIVAVVRKAVEDAQRELNDLGSYTFGPRRASLTKTIEDGNQEIAKAQQTMSALEEEARRQGLTLSRPQ